MDERIWKDVPLNHGETLSLDGVTITRKRLGHTVLISGNISAALARIAPDAAAVGLGEDVGTGDQAIRLGRDSILLNTKNLIDADSGWHSDGYAISQADGKYALLEIAGEHSEDLLAQGASIAFKHPSPSALIEFAGLACILVKQGTSWLLYVERPMLTYITGFLAGAPNLGKE